MRGGARAGAGRPRKTADRLIVAEKSTPSAIRSSTSGPPITASPMVRRCAICGHSVERRLGGGRPRKHCDACRRRCRDCGLLLHNQGGTRIRCLSCYAKWRSANKRARVHVPRLTLCTCAFCETVFLGENRRFCCEACLRAHRAQISEAARQRLCVGCRTWFTMSKSPRTKGLYCSRECAFAHYRDWRVKREAKQPQQPRQPTFKHCVECGSAFATKWSNQLLCGSECKRARDARRARDRYIRVAAASRKGSCIICGASFLTRPQHQKKLYCSPKCRKSMRKYSRIWSGVADPALRGELIAVAVKLKEFNVARYVAFCKRESTQENQHHA